MKLSLIIPVYKEEKIINPLIEHIVKLSKNEHIEIIVVDGDPTGSTIGRIKMRSVIGLIAKKGRASQMNAGAEYAKNRILFFLHADSILPEKYFSYIVKTFEVPGVTGGAFNLEINSSNLLLKLIAKTASFRSRLTKNPYGDQGLFLEKDIFHAIGGFSEIPLMEDIDIMQKLKKNNHTITILHQSIMTSPRRWEKQGIVFCTIRNVILSSLFYLGVKPAKLKKYY